MSLTERVTRVDKSGSNTVVEAVTYYPIGNVEVPVTYTFPTAYVEKYGLAEMLDSTNGGGGSYSTFFATVGSSNADYITDGVSDDVEINAAIVAANAAGGGIVQLLDQDYSISARVIPLSNVWLRGAGMFQTKLEATSSLTSGIIDNKATYDEDNPWYNGIVSDMELDGSGMNQTTEKKGINSDSLYNCKIMRIYCHDTTATGIGPDDFYGSTITECIVMNCGYMNKRTINEASWAASVFTFGTTTAHGHSVGDQIIITGMAPARYNGKYRITTVPDSTHFTIAMSNNSGNLTIPIDPGTATTFGIISDSLIGHNGIGIASGASYDEATIITNNICIGNQNNNFLIEADNSNTRENASYIYSNNISVNAGQCGFLNTGTINAQFTNNFDYGSQIGMQCAPVAQSRTITAASWLSNVVTFTTSTAHEYEVGDRVTVTGMTPSAYNGVYVVTGMPTSTTFTAALTSNPGTATVFGTAQDIAHPVEGTLLENNVLSHNVLYGVRLVSLADGCIVSGNTIKNCFNYGIFAGGSRCNINNNTIHDNGRDGIDVEVGSGSYNPITRVNITGNQIYNNSRYVASYDGIEVKPVSTAGISDLNIANNQIYDEQNTKTQRYGIILRSGGTITNASVSNNNLVGNLTGPILLQNTGDTLSVLNNMGVNPFGKITGGNITGSTTIDRTSGDSYTGTLTGNVTFTLTAGKVPGDRLFLALTQDGTGSRTVTWPSNFKKAGGTLTLSTGAAAVDTIVMQWDGTNWNETGRSLNLS